MADFGVILAPPGNEAAAAAPLERGAEHLAARWRVPLVAAALVTVDAGAASLSGTLGQAVVGGMSDRGSVLALASIFVVLCFSVGMYSAAGPSPYERFRLRGMASFYAVGLAMLMSGWPDWSAALLAAAIEVALLVSIGHYAESAVVSILVRARVWAAPAVVVGCDDVARRVAAALLVRPEIGVVPVGFVVTGHTMEPAARECARLLPVVGTTADLGELGAEVAIFTSSRDLAKAVAQRRQGVTLPRLVLVGDNPELGSLWLRPRMLGDAVGMEVGWDYGRRSSQLVKRFVDLTVAVPAALLTLPLMLLLAGMIVTVSPGPALYSQERVGRNGRSIRVLKLRTMHVNAERRLQEHLDRHPDARAEWERFFKLKNDPRVLPVIGSVIRRFSLDELPQLWNVIRGDLSLVGPRPFPAYHLQAFDAEFQLLRTSVQPGLTGLWQISARSDGDTNVQKSQDVFYIKNRSFWLDLYIIVQTLPAVLRGSGAC